ncbi:NitT/TauT family transport system substrate-binding protein [Paenibacillus sp. V4I9]|uniref:ABC transporter substrate-binding protein n=1 Tax=Paenibacillus sp. V4I9 TaxID=3042308 RepID=UPI00278AEB01|nr:ABC transporter substrate-binding protein [Paenibacillus sp. V4I9]MDQ0891781.1 NitT/TauT family transport system substrate-binding protein [Paenibacillus sp. V4I9]
MKKIFLITLASIITLTTACSSKPATDKVTGKAAADDKALTVTLPTWPGYGPLFLAKEKGFFKQRGVNIDLTIIDGLGERKQALAGGKVQGMATATDVTVSVAASYVPLGIVWVFDDSYGGDGILAKKEIASPADLKGKKIALEVGSTSHIFLLKVLEKAGLSDKDVEIVQMSAGDAGAAFVAGKVDAAVTWEPWLSKGTAAGGKVLVSSKDLTGIIVDSVSFASDVIKNQPEKMKAFVAAMNDAMVYWKANDSESIKIMANGLKMSEEEFKATVGSLKFYGLEDNKVQMGTADKPGPIYSTAKSAADFYFSKKLIEKAPDVNQLIVPSFVRELK